MGNWLAGKKTYLLAASVGVALLVLVALGDLTPELAIDILVFSAPCFAATFRDAIQKNHSQVLAVLADVAEAGMALKTHKTGDLVDLASKIAVDGEPFVSQYVPIPQAAAPKAGA